MKWKSIAKQNDKKYVIESIDTPEYLCVCIPTTNMAIIYP